MAYSTKTEVKAILRISDAGSDTEIDACIADVDALIDVRLYGVESSLPLNPVPDAINRASKYFAAAAWLRLDPASVQHEFQARKFDKKANIFLETYIEQTYYQGTMRSG